MATKAELYEHLARLQSENHRLTVENEAMRSVLMGIYGDTRTVLGIEAAVQAREEERIKASQISPK